MKTPPASRFSADLAILTSALLWGTLWIPLRRLHAADADGAATSAFGFLLPLAPLLLFALRDPRRALPRDRATFLAGFCLALSIALYSAALVRGSVARVVLLFYLTPLWSTLLARVVLHQPITRHRIATLVLAGAGLLSVLGEATAWPAPRSAADGMALVAGFAWAVAMLFVNRSAPQPALARVLAQFVFLAPIFLLVSLLFPAASDAAAAGAAPGLTPLLAAWPWLLAFALLWMLPVVWLTVVGASRIEPGRVAVFLMLEIAVSLATAAVLAGEPLGLREGIGAALITSASAVELLAGRRGRT